MRTAAPYRWSLTSAVMLPTARPRLVLSVMAVIAALLCVPAAALADGDPASDTLLIDNVFYPYVPPTSMKLQGELNGATATAARHHVPVKVALIGSTTDLGSIPQVFGKPQEYADFLDQEISFTTKQPLLVVMSNGYGTQGLTPAAASVVASLPKPTGDTSDDLATAALTAVEKIAGAEGHPLTEIRPAAAASAGGTSAVVLFAAVALVALAATAGVITMTLRRWR